ncbi:PQQ-like beta-propeller repeat protein [bacterium]|nr:PQQ-like beta-propeller repeat protein [bacterium]
MIRLTAMLLMFSFVASCAGEVEPAAVWPLNVQVTSAVATPDGAMLFYARGTMYRVDGESGPEVIATGTEASDGKPGRSRNRFLTEFSPGCFIAEDSRNRMVLLHRNADDLVLNYLDTAAHADDLDQLMMEGFIQPPQEGLALFCNHDQEVLAFSPDGKLQWSFMTGGRPQASCMPDDNHVMVFSTDGNLYGLDGAGQLQWILETDYTGGFNSLGYACFLKDGKLHCADRDGNILWSKVIEAQLLGSMVIASPLAENICFNSTSNLFCYSASGDELWRLRHESVSFDSYYYGRISPDNCVILVRSVRVIEGILGRSTSQTYGQVQSIRVYGPDGHVINELREINFIWPSMAPGLNGTLYLIDDKAGEIEVYRP